MWTGAGQLENGCKGPILFYTGNEGSIDAFWDSNGFVIDVLGSEWNALIVFGEMRYYGKSMPFPDWHDHKGQYLTTEQALADYAALILHLKRTLPGAQECPVVAFGGSYGGTLTAFFRTKYPHIVVGGLAASAPFGYYDPEKWEENNVNEFTWSDIVSTVYEQSMVGCLDAIAHVTRTISDFSPQALAKTFNTCRVWSPQRFQDFWTYAIESIPQMNYPYAVGSLPAWPVSTVCRTLLRSGPRPSLQAAAEVTDMYYGGGGRGGDCIPTEGQGGIPGGGPWPNAPWGYQSCTETLHQFSARGVRNFTFDLENEVSLCRRYYGVSPRPTSLAEEFGGYDVAAINGNVNLIFSNGLLDPWHGGGILRPSQDPSVHVFVMPLGAHHLDLRGPSSLDPANVTLTRRAEMRIIRSWIDAAGGLKK